MAKLTLSLPFLPEFPEDVRELVEAVFAAHQRAAKDNSNISTVTAMNAACGSGRFSCAVAAAVSTIGGMHAPVREARAVLVRATKADIVPVVENGGKLAGFGNSFFKGEIDPAWVAVAELVRAKFPRWQERLDEVESVLRELGKNVLPNAAIYTAIACEEANVPHGTEELFFIIPRLPIWAEVTL